MRAVVALLPLAGCLGEDAPRWPGAELPPCAASQRHTYRIDEIDLPETQEERERYGWDFDGDRTIDNAGGGIIAFLENALEIDLDAAPNAALDADQVHVALAVDRCAAPAYELVSILRGTGLDRRARPPRLVAEPATEYAMVADQLPGSATHGWASLPVPMMIDPSIRPWVESQMVIASITRIDDLELEGSLALTISQADIDNLLLPAAHAVIRDRAKGTQLQELLAVLDENEDGEISLVEMQDNWLVGNLARTDVDPEGPMWDPRPDGEPSTLSVGVGFHASRVQLVVE